MHYIYKITDTLNNKFYIGQTNNPDYRWYQHRSYAKGDKPQQYIHRAMAKYGIENFIFEIIATSKSQEDANEAESILITQYDSRSKEYGYNLTVGGSHGGHSEETKEKLRQAMLRQIAESGHPAQGTTRTDEQKARMSEIQRNKDNEAIYTEEVRQRMSEAHLGHVQSEETILKRSESVQKTWDQKRQVLIDAGELKCEAPGCEVIGESHYRLIDGIRYCNKHGLRVLRNNQTDKLPIHIQNNQSEEARRKCGAANIGRVAHNRRYFEPDQINYILNCGKSMKALSKEFGVTEKVIKRIRDGKY